MSHATRLILIRGLLVIAVVGNGWVARGQPPTVIVGARIVDGSGNEPFVGTVVIEAGRIRAVGRSVEVPSGAASIDGTGRTVMPGLVDVRLFVEGPGRAAARSLAAALYSGVTSIGAVGLAPDRYDAVRGEAGRPDAGPRAVIVGTLPASVSAERSGAEWARVLRAGVQAISMPADAPGVESVATDARTRGVRVTIEPRGGVGLDRLLALEPSLIAGTPDLSGGAATSLPQRNVTVAPDLASAGSGHATVSGALLTELAGSGVGETSAATTGDPSQWSARLDALRVLREARVRLAVASDAGETHLAPGWSTHVAVRLLVDAGATPLEAVTAATSGGAWALGLQSDRGFLAPGMRADLLIVHGDPTTTVTDLERIDRVFLGGVEVDRPALLAKIRRFDAAPPPTSAGPAPGADAGRTAEAGAKAASRLAAERPSTARRRGRTAAAAADAPASPPESSGASSALSASALSGAPPATSAVPTASERAPAAAPAGAAGTIERLDEPLVDDFEHGADRSALGGSWSSGSGEGSTPATIVMGRVVRGLRDHALHLTARMGDGPAPFVRASIPLSADGRAVDVSRFRGVRFDARGEGRYRVVLVTRGIADGRYYESYFSGSPLWTPVGIQFASIGQNGKGGHEPFTGRDLVEIRFEIARDPGQMAWLELDNVRFY